MILVFPFWQKGNNGYFNKQSGIQEYHLQHDHFKQIQEPELHRCPQWISILGTNAVIFLSFLMSCILTQFLIEVIGSLTSNPTFSNKISSEEKHLQKNWPSGMCLSGLFFLSFLALTVTRELPSNMGTMTIAHLAGAMSIRESRCKLHSCQFTKVKSW